MASRPDRSPSIEARDFDTNRKPLGSQSTTAHDDDESSRGLLDENESLLSNVADGIIQRDRQRMSREVKRWISYGSALLSCCGAGSLTAFSLYGYLLQSHLHYNQYQVNAISISAELAQYLPVPVFGYLVDRYSPRPVSLLSGVLFGLGYLLAAGSYRSGPAAEGGWPFWTMILAFVSIGMGTSSMYLAAVTACAKNTGNSKYKGLALAMPIACFGLSGVWQSQVGSKLLYETDSNGDTNVDVFRYFLFLGITLLIMGLIGSVAQVVVNQDEIIDEAIEDLQRSGVLEDSPFFRRQVIYEANSSRNYGTQGTDSSDQIEPEDISASMLKAREEELLKKNWLLNGETRRFLADHTMWFLAIGFFLITGPIETYINNVGTMIKSLYPPSTRSHIPEIPRSIPTSNTPDKHVLVLAITSTFARLAAGILTDLLSPSPSPPGQYRAMTPGSSQILNPFDAPGQHKSRVWRLITSMFGLSSAQDSSFEHLGRRKRTISRLTLLILTAALLGVGLFLQLVLIPRQPEAFPAVTSFVGLANGASFSLVPLLISSVWGVENFGTNWGIVATMPAFGAAAWSALYSFGYQSGIQPGDDLCYGARCWMGVVGGMFGASTIAVVSWIWVGWGKDGWWSRGVVV